MDIDTNREYYQYDHTDAEDKDQRKKEEASSVVIYHMEADAETRSKKDQQ